MLSVNVYSVSPFVHRAHKNGPQLTDSVLTSYPFWIPGLYLLHVCTIILYWKGKCCICLTSFNSDIDNLKRIVLGLSYPVPVKAQFQFTSFYN